MPENVTDRRCCHKCHKTVTGKRKLSKCGRCHSITYCGQECQREDWPRHSKYCIPVMVAEIPGKGRGLVASRDFKKGELIFKETAAITIHAPSEMVPLNELKEQISKLSEEQKTRFHKLTPQGIFNRTQLASALKQDCLQELDIFVSNSSELHDTLSLFLTPPLLNHSCAPNAFKEKHVGDEIKVLAAKDIFKGEEVTECYISGLMTKSEMKTKIKTIFSFDCKCGVCSGSIPDQDGIILEINRLLVQVPKKEKNKLLTEASKLERIVDLTKQLYIGHIKERFINFVLYVWASQMARDPIRLAKSMKLLKEEIGATGMMESTPGKDYKILESKLVKWSGAFQSKKKPSKEEKDEFASF